MRRVVILALLFGAMQLVLPLGAAGHGSQWLLTFGFLILAAYSVGELAVMLKLPKITGYLAAGVLFGPSLFNTVTPEAIGELRPVSSLAIALIAYLAGAELRWSEVRERGATIAKVLTAEMVLGFVAMSVALIALGDRLPFLQGTSGGSRLAFALLFASVAVVHSPAVVMALLSETKAGGPVARTTLGVVLVSDVVVVILFSAVLAMTRAVVPPTGANVAGVSLTMIIWELGGAVIVGALLGAAVALYLRFVRHELVLFAIVVAFFGMVISRMVHVETLLALLTAGFVTENFSRHEDGEAIRHAMERSAAPVFVAFFALAGAEMGLREVAAVWPLLLPIIAVRTAAVWGGTRVGVRWSGAPPEMRRVWMGLVPQAGVAIGLAAAIAQAYPVRGAQMRTLFLAVVAINQVIGPILFRFALNRSREIVSATGEATPVQPHPTLDSPRSAP
ncbi:MAG: cation:proton antiporter [Gemmatimonadaceae bacterium]